MTDDKTISERDAVKRERAAYVRGSKARSCFIGSDPSTIWQKEAAEVYPLPKVKRPRVVKDSVDVYWRVIDGGLEWSYNSEMWRPAGDTTGQRMFLTTERIPMLAALLANPDELVEADD